MMHRIQFEQWVPFAIEEVFLFFANPQNLPGIMPPNSATQLAVLRLVSPPVFNGQQVAQDRLPRWRRLGDTDFISSCSFYSYLRMEWTALITEFGMVNHHFADIQKAGPFKRFQHRHELSTELRGSVSGTIVRDRSEYDPGFGFLGDLAHKLFIANGLKQTFDYRQKMLEKLLA